MKLTGKCKKKFEQWLENTYSIHSTEWEELNKTCRNALIVEFFDSVGIYISLEWKYKYFEIGIIGIKNNITISLCKNDTRSKATNAAIEKANAIYNENKL